MIRTSPIARTGTLKPAIPAWLWWLQWFGGFLCGTAFGLFIAAVRGAA